MAHPTIEGIRETRREIAREHGYDMDRLFAYYRRLDRLDQEEEEVGERAGAIGELRALLERLEKREQAAEAEGMQELAGALSRERARLYEAVKRPSRQRESGAAGAK